MIVLYFIINKENIDLLKETSNDELSYANSFYSNHIETIFNENCIACHHDKKKLGGLNMLSPSKINLGGKNGSVITIGNAYKSEIYKRLILPISNEKHMPKGKDSLTKDEIKLIEWWINSGASFTKKTDNYIFPEKIKSILN